MRIMRGCGEMLMWRICTSVDDCDTRNNVVVHQTVVQGGVSGGDVVAWIGVSDLFWHCDLRIFFWKRDIKLFHGYG